jgi:hypothetical protein
MALPWRCSGEEGASLTGPRAALSYGGAPRPTHVGWEVVRLPSDDVRRQNRGKPVVTLTGVDRRTLVRGKM